MDWNSEAGADVREEGGEGEGTVARHAPGETAGGCVSAEESEDRRVEAHDEDPAITLISRIVQEQLKDGVHEPCRPRRPIEVRMRDLDEALDDAC